jgi:hypothetical protein
MEERRGANFSDCGLYRYSLHRIWDDSKPLVMFIGLNPSTPNADTDNPTIKRVKQIAINLGYGGIYIWVKLSIYAMNKVFSAPLPSLLERAEAAEKEYSASISHNREYHEIKQEKGTLYVRRNYFQEGFIRGAQSQGEQLKIAALKFHEWREQNQYQIDNTEQRTHTMDELWERFEQDEKPDFSILQLHLNRSLQIK